MRGGQSPPRPPTFFSDRSDRSDRSVGRIGRIGRSVDRSAGRIGIFSKNIFKSFSPKIFFPQHNVEGPLKVVGECVDRQGWIHPMLKPSGNETLGLLLLSLLLFYSYPPWGPPKIQKSTFLDLGPRICSFFHGEFNGALVFSRIIEKQWFMIPPPGPPGGP